MKAHFSILLAMLSLAPLVSGQGKDAVSTQEYRSKTLADLALLGGREEAVPAFVLEKDPFYPPAADLRWEPEPGQKSETPLRDDAEIVKLLAAQLQPSGSVALGGEPFLLFTERRQKIGDKLSVALDGVEYTVEIVSITSTRFRIRYNGHEAERTIK